MSPCRCSTRRRSYCLLRRGLPTGARSSSRPQSDARLGATSVRERRPFASGIRRWPPPDAPWRNVGERRQPIDAWPAYAYAYAYAQVARVPLALHCKLPLTRPRWSLARGATLPTRGASQYGHHAQQHQRRAKGERNGPRGDDGHGWTAIVRGAQRAAEQRWRHGHGFLTGGDDRRLWSDSRSGAHRARTLWHVVSEGAISVTAK